MSLWDCWHTRFRSPPCRYHFTFTAHAGVSACARSFLSAGTFLYGTKYIWNVSMFWRQIIQPLEHTHARTHTRLQRAYYYSSDSRGLETRQCKHRVSHFALRLPELRTPTTYRREWVSTVISVIWPSKAAALEALQHRHWTDLSSCAMRNPTTPTQEHHDVNALRG